MSAQTVGILGAGQLGQMLAIAARDLGLRTLAYDPAPNPCAARETECITAAWSDHDALARFCDAVDVATLEFENVPLDAARFVAERVELRPSVASLETAQDRAYERGLFRRLNIDTPTSDRVDTDEELLDLVQRVRLPKILKTRRDGYDGKGQAWIHEPEQAEDAWHAIRGKAALLDEVIPFEREISVIVTRDAAGTSVVYPLNENTHESGILRVTRAPAADVDDTIRAHAKGAARSVADALGHIGTLAMEFFLTADGRLLANEIAPRVHNTGHWTIEGSATSQFSNHMRAVAGLELGLTDTPKPATMINIIGDAVEPQAILDLCPSAHVHLYGKEPRAGRKLGHVTVIDADASPVIDLLAS